MKKTLRTILAGAVALLAVSCYDDSDLRNKYGDLNDRVTAIESTLNAEVGGINDLLARLETLEGQVAAIKVETVDGVTTLTLSDESSVVLSKNGVLTVVDGGWATVAPDGTVTPLGVKVNHELDFKVENGELKYAPKGETNFTATGVKISTYTAHVIGNVVKAEDGKSVAITIGDQTFELPLVSSSAAAIGLSREEIFVAYEATKSVTLTATDIEDCYVMSKPDGWRATFEGTTLVVTAPSADAFAFGAGEASGEILIHATDSEGDCKVAALNVQTGAPVKLTVQDGNITVFNSLTQTATDYWGETSTSFLSMTVGFVPAEMFIETSPEQFFEVAASYYFEGYPCANFENAVSNKDNELPVQYVEGEYEEFNHTLSIAEFAATVGTVSDFTYEPNENYVIWAVPVGMKPDTEHALYAFMEPVTTFEVKSSELDDVDLEFALYGADEFYLTAYAKNEIAMYLENDAFEQYLTLGPYYQGGPWKTFLEGNVAEMGKKYPSGIAEVKLSDIYTGFADIAPESEYCVLAFPYYRGKDHASYVFATDVMPYLVQDGIKTKELVLNPELKCEVTTSPYEYGVNYTITPPDGGTTYYYFSTEEITDEEFYAQSAYSYTTEYEENNETFGINPGETYYLYTYSIAGGEKGNIEKIVVSTPELEFDEDVKVELVSLEPKADDATVMVAKFNVTGANKIGVYARNEGNDANVIKYAFTDSWTFTRVIVEDGVAIVEFKPYTYTTLYVIGYNVADTSVDAGASNVTSVGNLVKIML